MAYVKVSGEVQRDGGGKVVDAMAVADSAGKTQAALNSDLSNYVTLRFILKATETSPQAVIEKKVRVVPEEEGEYIRIYPANLYFPALSVASEREASTAVESNTTYSVNMNESNV